MQKAKNNSKTFSYYLFFLLIFSDLVLSSGIPDNFRFIAETFFKL